MDENFFRWVKTELLKWQYGEVPEDDEDKPLDVAVGMKKMAQALLDVGGMGLLTLCQCSQMLDYAAHLARRQKAADDELLMLAELMSAQTGECPNMAMNWEHPKGGCEKACRDAFYPACWIEYVRDKGKQAQIAARTKRLGLNGGE